MPWKARPNSHILRSIVAIHARTNAPREPTWPAYVDWVTGLCDRLEIGEPLSNWRLTGECASEVEETYDPFVAELRRHVRDLRHVAATEYSGVLSVANRRIRPIRVFVSSRQKEFAKLRAKLAIQQRSDIQFLLAERFFPWNGGVADGMGICESQIDHADVFLGIYGNEYGARSPNRHSSPIEEELRHASKNPPPGATLLFSTVSHSREPNLVQMFQKYGSRAVRPMFEDIDAAIEQMISSIVPTISNQSLQGTLDPSLGLAAASPSGASSAPELKR